MAAAEPRGDAQPRRVRWPLAAGALAVVVAVAAGVWATHGKDGSVGPDPEVIYGLEPMTAGATDFSMGDFSISAPGKDVRILSIKPLMSPNVDFLGAYVVWPRDAFGNAVAGGPGFPFPDQPRRHPIDEIIPAAETSYVPAGRTAAEPLTVTAGFRIRSGVGAVNGVTITYQVDGKTHRQNFAQAAVGCVKPEPCDHGAAGFDKSVLRRYGLTRAH